MKKLGWQVEVIIEEKEEVDFESIKSADLVGISTITSTAPGCKPIISEVI